MKFCVNTYRMDKKADESIRNKIQVVLLMSISCQLAINLLSKSGKIATF